MRFLQFTLNQDSYTSKDACFLRVNEITLFFLRKERKAERKSNGDLASQLDGGMARRPLICLARFQKTKTRINQFSYELAMSLIKRTITWLIGHPFS